MSISINNTLASFIKRIPDNSGERASIYFTMGPLTVQRVPDKKGPKAGEAKEKEILRVSKRILNSFFEGLKKYGTSLEKMDEETLKNHVKQSLGLDYEVVNKDASDSFSKPAYMLLVKELDKRGEEENEDNIYHVFFNFLYSYKDENGHYDFQDNPSSSSKSNMSQLSKDILKAYYKEGNKAQNKEGNKAQNKEDIIDWLSRVGFDAEASDYEAMFEKYGKK
jgi:hypothetical protein